MKIYNNILKTIGNTPLVKLNNCVPASPHNYFAKMEFFNPGGSVKDRIALKIVEEAEKRGQLKPGGTVVEATSGNTGVGLAMVCAVKGYKCVITIPDKMSEEKINTLRSFGADVRITPSGVAPDDPKSHYSVAKDYVAKNPGSFLANQFHNPDNVRVHFETTGPEIWDQTGGKIDAFVAGVGTGGTLSGVGKYLKEKNPKIKIISPDPIGSILYDVHKFGEIRDPVGKYEVEGIGEDMIPENVHFKVIDAFVKTEDKETFLKSREILRKEGLFVGPSCASALLAAMKYFADVREPQNIVVLFPDNGSKYLSKAYNDNWMKSKGFI
jgi:cystathionine beta-synthase